MNLSQVVEALLFSAQKPLTPRELVVALRNAGAEDELTPNELAKTTEAAVAAALEQLKIEYLEQERAFQLLEKGQRSAICPLGPATFPRRETSSSHATGARDPRHHCLPPADYPGRCGSGPRGGNRKRVADVDGARAG